MEGALAFFTFSDTGNSIECTIIQSTVSNHSNKEIIVEAGQYHAMTAAPKVLGYPGHAIVFENSGHLYEPGKSVKTYAQFAPPIDSGFNGNPEYYEKTLLPLCKHAN